MFENLRNNGLLINKRIKDISYLTMRLKNFAAKEQENEDFYRFKCNEFFAGKTMAEINEKIFYEKKKYISRKINQLKFLIKEIEENS